MDDAVHVIWRKRVWYDANVIATDNDGGRVSDRGPYADRRIRVS